MSSNERDLLKATLQNPYAVTYMLTRAAEACKLATEARVNVTRLFEMVMLHHLPIGKIIDRREKGRPEFIRQVATLLGRDHGTSIFRIETKISVDVDPEVPYLASWSCYATPISEKTGRDMSGSGPNQKNHSGHVKLSGGVFFDSSDLNGDEYVRVATAKVERFFSTAAQLFQDCDSLVK